MGQGRDILFNCVLKVGEEAQPVLKLNLEGLVVNGRPSSDEVLLGAVHTIFAEDGFDLVLVH